ncbi:MAG: hypothetical protein ACN0LA_00200 [Candidatus Longimicrobiales bacterium M2_2A_002]
MRRYTDSRDREWDIVVGRESFGALYALFVPSGETRAETRQTLLQEDSKARAQAAIEAMSEDEMDDLFERSEPKRL